MQPQIGVSAMLGHDSENMMRVFAFMPRFEPHANMHHPSIYSAHIKLLRKGPGNLRLAPHCPKPWMTSIVILVGDIVSFWHENVMITWSHCHQYAVLAGAGWRLRDVAG